MTLSQILQMTIRDGVTAVDNYAKTDNNRDLTDDEYSIKRYKLATSSGEVTVNFDGVATATFVAILPTAEILWKLNAGSQWKANEKNWTILNTDSITGLTIENESATDTVYVTVILCAY